VEKIDGEVNILSPPPPPKITKAQSFPSCSASTRPPADLATTITDSRSRTLLRPRADDGSQSCSSAHRIQPARSPYPYLLAAARRADLPIGREAPWMGRDDDAPSATPEEVSQYLLPRYRLARGRYSTALRRVRTAVASPDRSAHVATFSAAAEPTLAGLYEWGRVRGAYDATVPSHGC